MRKKSLSYSGAERVYWTLSSRKGSKFIELGLSHLKSDPSDVSIDIRIKSKTNAYQVSQFFKEHKELIEHLTNNLKLLEPSTKPGPKADIPELAYTLNRKFGWKPKKIEDCLRLLFPVFWEADVEGHVNTISIAQFIQRRKRSEKKL